MRKFDSNYIIGEIGQNHNGSVDIAKILIDLVSFPVEDTLFGHHIQGMDAVKLTKRDLDCELSASEMNRVYNNANSFGKTYGEHRKYLELSNEAHFELYQYAKSKGLDFVETLCSPSCLSLLDLFQPDFLKVASRDLTNIPLLESMAKTKLPIIISLGMANQEDLSMALNIIEKYHNDITILHCVSQYPTDPKNANLLSIPYLIKKFPQYNIGYSDHTIGISAPIAAVALGAKVIEKHITVDRRLKGTDQKGSLGPEGITRMVRDLRLLDLSLGSESFQINEDIQSTREKLERSIASNRLIQNGDILSEHDIHLLSPGDGYSWKEKNQVIGKKARANIPKNEIIYPSQLSD